MSEPQSKKRKARPRLNCAECRRTKLKCDRQVPCNHCIKRDCPEICPDQIRSRTRKTSDVHSAIMLRRLEQSGELSGPSSLGDEGAGTDAATAMLAPSTGLPPVSDNISNSVLSSTEAEPAHNQPAHAELTGLPVLSPVSTMPRPTEGDTQVFGTLMLGHNGRSKYLGPTAGSEWLQDQEAVGGDSAIISRAASPEDHPVQNSSFPFGSDLSTRDLLSRLPPLSEAQRLAECYYRYFAWQHNIVARSSFSATLSSVYASRSSTTDPCDHHKLALVYAILAMGTLHDLELEANDPIVSEYLALAKQSLTRGSFMKDNTITSLQALHIIGHVELETEDGKNGDSAWLVWGLSMRMVAAMGLHRDGFRWGLDLDAIQDRRSLYWQCQSTDVMQANCFSRPPSLSSDYADTLFPLDIDPDTGLSMEYKSFHQLKYELSQISEAVIECSLQIRQPSIERMQALQEQLVAFEKAVPFELRCRTAYLSLPSLYPDPESALVDTPETDKRDFGRTLQQFTLSITISETMLFLNRPLYAKSFSGIDGDPTQTPHGRAYLTVVERSNLITTLVAALFDLLPRVTARYWWLWYHSFTAAVCLGTLPLISPGNMLVNFALCQLDSTIALFTRATKYTSSRRLARNLEWLSRLRSRITAKIQTHQSVTTEIAENEVENAAEDGGLLGWRTRLVQRAAKGGKTIVKTIQPSPSTISHASQDIAPLAEIFSGSSVPGHLNDPQGASNDITDQLLHDFWDPMLLNNSANALDDHNQLSEWWDLCMSAPP